MTMTMEKEKIFFKIADRELREKVAGALAAEGYTVKIVSKTLPGSKQQRKGIEFWSDSEDIISGGKK